MHNVQRFLAALLAATLLLLGGLQSGAVLAAPSTPTADFTDNGDGTVTHKLTGLTWMRCAMGQTWTGTTCSGTASTYTWDAAKAQTSAFAGKADWRLPTIRELSTIIEMDAINPAINTTIFPDTPPYFFWSASASAVGSNSAWRAHFYYGSADGYGSRSDSYSVRLVRGGQPLGLLALNRPTTDYLDNGDGTVTHTPTALTWKRCAEGQIWSGSTCSGSADKSTWATATALTTTFAGKSDWRLPTQVELLSLVDFTLSNPSINSTIFPNLPTTDLSKIASWFWSASAHAGGSDEAWMAAFYDGSSGYIAKTVAFPVRLVRGGQSSGPSPTTAYDPSTNRLTIPTITVGGTTYSNVVVTVGSVVSYNSGTPGTTDSYDSATGILTIPTITVGSTAYSNVKVMVGSVISINGVSTTPTGTTATPLSAQVTDALLFAFAGANYPDLVSGTPTSGQYQQYTYQLYPDTGNAIGIDTTNDNVVVYGPYVGNVVVALGPKSNFLGAINAWESKGKPVTPPGVTGAEGEPETISVKGLKGGELVLANNVGDALTVTRDGTYTFATPLSAAARLRRIVKEPADQVCQFTKRRMDVIDPYTQQLITPQVADVYCHEYPCGDSLTIGNAPAPSGLHIAETTEDTIYFEWETQPWATSYGVYCGTGPEPANDWGNQKSFGMLTPQGVLLRNLLPDTQYNCAVTSFYFSPADLRNCQSGASSAVSFKTAPTCVSPQVLEDGVCITPSTQVTTCVTGAKTTLQNYDEGHWHGYVNYCYYLDSKGNKVTHGKLEEYDLSNTALPLLKFKYVDGFPIGPAKIYKYIYDAKVSRLWEEGAFAKALVNGKWQSVREGVWKEYYVEEYGKSSIGNIGKVHMEKTYGVYKGVPEQVIAGKAYCSIDGVYKMVTDYVLGPTGWIFNYSDPGSC